MSIYHEAPTDDNGPDGHSWGYIIEHAKDWYWSELTGNCGGCGNYDCHPGQVCPSNRAGYCTACPTRRATGEVR